MEKTIEELLLDNPSEWINGLPAFQRETIDALLTSGLSYEDAAKSWASTTTENTFGFSASGSVGKKGAFVENLKHEIRKFLCGDKKYKTERDGLFGQKGLARTYIVTQIAVSISPHISVASTVISPIVALLLASFGKIALNAWCSLDEQAQSS
jgi:hypothetical protein